MLRAGASRTENVTIDPRTPVIVGAGQVLRRDVSDAESCEPAAMIVDALRCAARDSGSGDRLLRRADSVRCVPVLAWPYANLAALVAQDLGVRPRETVQSCAIGGDGPLRLVNDAAAAIAAGALDVVLVAGAEAGASMRAARASGDAPPWRHQDQRQPPPRVLDADREPLNAPEAAARLHPPVLMYALLESAARAAAGADAEAHRERIARLWSAFSAVAAENPHAWIQRRRSPAEIATPGPENRLVAAPYTKLLTANIQVNMASGLIVASAEAAERAGVPRDRWVFVHAGAQAYDEWHVSERRELAASPAIRVVGAAVLGHADLAIDEVAHLDLYSCFPVAVEISARELGLTVEDPARVPTVTGGLTFAGGPGNNYAGHAVATLVGRLRDDHDAYGLASAVGWYMTKHALGIYSARVPHRPFASLHPRPRQPSPRRAESDYAGPATIEAHTVSFGRDGAAEDAIVSALTRDGRRVLVRTADREVVDALADADAIGWQVAIDQAAASRGAGVRL